MNDFVKKFIVALGVLVLLLLLSNIFKPTVAPESTDETQDQVSLESESTNKSIIGASVEGRNIELYSFGTGDIHLLFVGGIHGGYEWNSVVVAEKLIAELQNGKIIPSEKITVDIIPNLNPDGVYRVLGMTGGFTEEQAMAIAPDAVPEGRFNSNSVDLNRNFDCRWQPISTWRGQEVSAGTEPFSEPEAVALRDFVLQTDPHAVVFWHSQANTVYASECEAGIIPTTRTLMETYSKAGKYGAVATFDAYPVTGDAEGWLASKNIPAITVELETKTSSEWERNRAGSIAIMSLYGRVQTK